MADELLDSKVRPTEWGAPSSFFTGDPRDGDLLTDQDPTQIGYWWYQSMIDEIRNVIVGAGLIFNPFDTTQLLEAIEELLQPPFELREDDGFELREDGSFELRQ